jgi:hypothetical protein
VSPDENEKLLNLLKKHKKMIGYSINDLKGLSPTFLHSSYTNGRPMQTRSGPSKEANPFHVRGSEEGGHQAIGCLNHLPSAT